MLEKLANADYVRGFADGEGGFHGHFIHIANTDWRLIEMIRDTLDELGIECHVQKRKAQKPNHKPSYRIVIHGALNLARYAVLIGFCQERKQRALENYLKSICRKGKEYNLEDYNKYLEQAKKGASIRQMSKSLGIQYSAMWKRIRNGIYPIDKEDVEYLKIIQSQD